MANANDDPTIRIEIGDESGLPTVDDLLRYGQTPLTGFGPEASIGSEGAYDPQYAFVKSLMMGFGVKLQDAIAAFDRTVSRLAGQGISVSSLMPGGNIPLPQARAAQLQGLLSTYYNTPASQGGYGQNQGPPPPPPAPSIPPPTGFVGPKSSIPSPSPTRSPRNWDYSWKEALALAVKDAQSAEQVQVDDDGNIIEGTSGRRPAYMQRFGSWLQNVGGFAKQNYQFAPRGFELLTRRVGQITEHIGGAISARGAATAATTAATSGASTAGSALVGTAGALAGTATLAGVATVGGMALTYGLLKHRFENESQKIAAFNPHVAAATAFREYLQTTGDIRRGRVVGPQLAHFMRDEAYLSNAAQNMGNAGTKMLLDVFDTSLSDIGLTLEGIFACIAKGFEEIGQGWNVIEPEVLAMRQLMINWIPGAKDVVDAVKEMHRIALEQRPKVPVDGGLNLQAIFGPFNAAGQVQQGGAIGRGARRKKPKLKKPPAAPQAAFPQANGNSTLFS